MKVIYLPKGILQRFMAVFVILIVSCVYSFGGGFKQLNVFLNDDTYIPIFSVETDNKNLALSFDVAEGEDYTGEIIKVLEKHNIKATFFLTGQYAEKNPDLVKALVKNGHELGNHTFTHRKLKGLETKIVEQEIKQCCKTIEDTTGIKTTLVRVPYGEYDGRIMEAVANQKHVCIQGDINALDIRYKGALKTNEYIMEKATSGSIIMLPSGAAETVEVLEKTISNFNGQGYCFVKVSELIHKSNCYVDHSGRQRKTN